MTAALRIGIISDTHLTRPSDGFVRLVEACFMDTGMILHAGDLTDPSILGVFGDRPVHAVHGNMCSLIGQQLLPPKKEIRVGGFTIGLVHRVGNSYDFEDRLIELFPEADCIVYGHTHQPACHRTGGVLYINPGSFTGGRGSTGSYAILEVGETMTATLHQTPRLP
ncbi:MAG: metallophosphoesterase family protein [Thermodesulfobacteriota bacterium]